MVDPYLRACRRPQAPPSRCSKRYSSNGSAPGPVPRPGNRRAEQVLKFQSKWAEILGDLVEKQCESLEVQFNAVLCSLEEAFQLSADSEELRGRALGLWQRNFECAPVSGGPAAQFPDSNEPMDRADAKMGGLHLGGELSGFQRVYQEGNYNDLSTTVTGTRSWATWAGRTRANSPGLHGCRSSRQAP